jgi:hypothetical protein
MVTKRKLSDLTTQETGTFLHMVENFKQILSNDEDNEKSFIASLEHAATKIAPGVVSALLPDNSDTWY